MSTDDRYLKAARLLIDKRSLPACNTKDLGRNRQNTGQIVGIKRHTAFKAFPSRWRYYIVWDDATKPPTATSLRKIKYYYLRSH